MPLSHPLDLVLGTKLLFDFSESPGILSWDRDDTKDKTCTGGEGLEREEEKEREARKNKPRGMEPKPIRTVMIHSSKLRGVVWKALPPNWIIKAWRMTVATRTPTKIGLVKKESKTFNSEGKKR